MQRGHRTSSTVHAFSRSIQEKPLMPTRMRSQLDLSQTLLHRIFRISNVPPHKIQVVQELKLVEHRILLEYVFQMQKLARQKANFIHNLIMDNQDHFHLIVNKQNMPFWGIENPRIVHQPIPHPIRVTIRRSVNEVKVHGLYLFEDETKKRNNRHLIKVSRNAREFCGSCSRRPPTIELLRHIFGRRLLSRKLNGGHSHLCRNNSRTIQH
ncbi:putative nuclear transport [Trypoxylus dichotomus]